MPRALKETSQFKTDKKRIKKSGRYDWEKMCSVVKELLNDRPLDKRHLDHELSGGYEGVRECHVEPDWLLIYDKDVLPFQTRRLRPDCRCLHLTDS